MMLSIFSQDIRQFTYFLRIRTRKCMDNPDDHQWQRNIGRGLRTAATGVRIGLVSKPPLPALHVGRGSRG